MNNQRILKRSFGFTLIELLTVIGIIGILSSIAIVAINPKDQTDKAKDKKVLHELSEARSQAIIFWSDHNFSFDNVCNNLSRLASGGNCEDNDSSWAKTGIFTNDSKCCADSDGYIGTEKSSIIENSGTYKCSVSDDDGDGDGDGGGEEGGGGGGEGEINCAESPLPNMCCMSILDSDTCNSTTGCHFGWFMCIAD